MQKSQAKTSNHVIRKMLILTLVIALIIFVVAYARHFWSSMTSEKVQTRQQIATLTKKIENLNQQLQTANSNNPVDVQAYTTAQVKDAFLLVRTAATALQHDQDVLVAKQLLQLAYEHLANLQGAKIEQAKAALTADQAKLNAVHTVDMPTIQDKLTTLDKLINVLPAIKSTTDQVITPASGQTSKAKTTTASTQPWYQSVTNVFSDLKSVVRVRKKSDRDLTVADVDVARAQFKLIIEQLRWAAFYNNSSVFQRSIINAQELLPQIFDTNSESVQKFSATLQELQKIQLSTQVPNIQDSVNALQAILGR